MPTYSYACTECDNRFDEVQAFTDDALSTCPQCSGRLRKLFNSVGVVFKGSGFYRTDSRDSGKNATSDSSGSENGAEKSPEKSPERSPEKTAPKGSEKSTGGDSSSAPSSSSSSTPATTSS